MSGVSDRKPFPHMTFKLPFLDLYYAISERALSGQKTLKVAVFSLVSIARWQVISYTV